MKRNFAIILGLVLLLALVITQNWSYEDGKLIETTVVEATADTLTVEYTEAEIIDARNSMIAVKHTAQAIINDQQDIVDNMNSAIAGYDELLSLIEALKPEPAIEDTTEVD